jgi:hypothetical protein
MASMPVRAAQPLANAARISSTPTEAVRFGAGGGSGCSGWPRNSPTTTTTDSARTNTAAGTANTRPPASTPRRLMPTTTASAARHSSRVQGSSAGKADVSAATPAATETATLST